MTAIIMAKSPRDRANGPGAWPNPARGSDMPEGTCTVADCDKPVVARGFCRKHYNAARWRGMGVLPKLSVEERFWAKVDKTDGCWLWTASLDGSGYGLFGVGDKRIMRAHRYAYQLLVGPIPGGLQLDHLCRVRNCVNPAHLEPVTGLENVRRGSSATKTHCVNGHEYTPENTYRRSSGRQCRACHKIWNERYQRRKRGSR